MSRIASSGVEPSAAPGPTGVPAGSGLRLGDPNFAGQLSKGGKTSQTACFL